MWGVWDGIRVWVAAETGVGTETKCGAGSWSKSIDNELKLQCNWKATFLVAYYANKSSLSFYQYVNTYVFMRQTCLTDFTEHWNVLDIPSLDYEFIERVINLLSIPN